MIRDRLKEGIHFIPTLLTMGNILCGFFSIISSINQDWIHACIAIAIAFFLDGLDGRIARMSDTESEFGLQLDSMADLISFGVAPAILAYTNWLYFYERLGILLGFLFVCGAALRLARFNAHDVKQDSSAYFNGMPTPAAAGVVVSFYFIEYKFFVLNGSLTHTFRQSLVFAIPLLLLVLSYLMLSNFKYPTFKNISWHKEHPFGLVFCILLAVFLSASFPLTVFSVFFIGYFFLGLINFSWITRVIGGTFSYRTSE